MEVVGSRLNKKNNQAERRVQPELNQLMKKNMKISSIDSIKSLGRVVGAYQLLSEMDHYSKENESAFLLKTQPQHAQSILNLLFNCLL